MTRTTWRLRLVATCLVLTAVAFSQSPGLVAADTKLDLTQNPGGFLERALHLWDDQAFFGQLQNQAYGYLWPVGPYYWLGHTVAFPSWALQRLWWSVLLCVAFLGVVRLTRLLGVPSPAARWVAGLAFALSPRVMTTLGPISAETLPMVLAPWVLVPLVALVPGRSIRRAAAWSAVAVLFMGGINAVATLAAMSLGLVWILTESAPGVRARLLGWWVLCSGLATAWFVGPLLLLGRFSPPFLDWIESSSVTTSVTDGSAALRGTTDWVAYLAGRGGPEWPAGFQLVSERALVLGTAVVAIAGAVGLVLRSTRHRRFLVVSVAGGLIALVAAHVSAAGPWGDGVLAPSLRVLLDGALSPLRNVHKFDVWIRLPLAVGVAWSVNALLVAVRRRLAGRGSTTTTPTLREWWPGTRAVVAGAAVLVVAGGVGLSAAPALRGDLTTGRTFVSVPGYWLEVSGWLARESAEGRALVIPGASFGTYLWGDPRDEPLQPYASTPWAVRDAVPLSSAGNIRALDEVERVLADGRGDPALAEYLSRMGVSILVVRNDLDLGAVDAPRPVLVHQAIERSGGLSLVGAFGPILTTGSGTEIVADGGIDASYNAVEVYRVAGPTTQRAVVLRDASTPTLLAGESEGVLGVGGTSGEVGSVLRPVDVPGDQSLPASAGAAITDSARRWEVNFGRVHDNTSSTLTPDAPWTLPRRVHDFDVTPTAVRPETAFPGGISVDASSSRGDAAALALDPAAGPWNAIDGRPETVWAPRGALADGQWWRLTFGRERDVSGTRLSVVTVPAGVRGTVTLEVASQGQTRRLDVALPSSGVELPGGLGRTGSLTVTVASTDLPRGTVPGLAEVTVPVLSSGRTLVVPAVRAPTSELVLRTRDGRREACVIKVPAACYPPMARVGEEDGVLDRTVTTTGFVGGLQVSVQPRSGAALDKLLVPPGAAAVASASSVWVPDPVGRPQAAIDRDQSTAWWAAAGDRTPTLTIDLPRRTAVSWLQISESLGLAASRPLGVTVSLGGRSYPVFSDEDGFLRFPRTTADRISLTFTSSRPQLSYDTTTGVRSVLPLGISDIVLGEADSQRRGLDADAAVLLPCGFGPTVRLMGTGRVTTSVTTTVGALLAGRPATAVPCGPSGLPSGQVRVVVESTAEFWVAGMRWSTQQSAGGQVETPRITSWSSTERVVEVVAVDRPRTLELGENSSAGWVATVDGAELTPVRVDGWRQGWVLPSGVGGTVRLRFAPDSTFRAALAVGGLGVVGLLLLALVPPWSVGRPWTAERRRARPRARMVLLALAALVALGPVAVITSLLAARPRRVAVRAVLVVIGSVAAIAPAAIAPWPTGTTWSDQAQSVAAILVSSGAGLVLGALVGPGRRPVRAQAPLSDRDLDLEAASSR